MCWRYWGSQVQRPGLTDCRQSPMLLQCKGLSRLIVEYRGPRLPIRPSPQDQDCSPQHHRQHSFGGRKILQPGCCAQHGLFAVSWAADKRSPRPCPNTAGTREAACRTGAWNLHRQCRLSGGELRAFCGSLRLWSTLGSDLISDAAQLLWHVVYSLFHKLLTNTSNVRYVAM